MITVNLDYDDATEITVTLLLDTLKNVEVDIINLKRMRKMGDFPLYQAANLRDNKKIRKQLRAAIEYHSSPSEFEALGI